MPPIGFEVASQMILDFRVPLTRWLVAVLFLAHNALVVMLTHQAANAMQLALLDLVAQLLLDPNCTQHRVTLRMTHTDAGQ
jgi:hypothetical protein